MIQLVCFIKISTPCIASVVQRNTWVLYRRLIHLLIAYGLYLYIGTQRYHLPISTPTFIIESLKMGQCWSAGLKTIASPFQNFIGRYIHFPLIFFLTRTYLSKAHSHYCIFLVRLRQRVAFLQGDRKFSISGLMQPTEENADHCVLCESA